MTALQASVGINSSHRQGSRPVSGYDRTGFDFYCEPRWAVDALLDAEHFFGPILDPACGKGNIVDTCWDRGLEARGFDIADRSRGRFSRGDFLDTRTLVPMSIICNPPFSLAERFIERALGLAQHKVAMLLRWSFAEGGTGRTAKAKLRAWCLDVAPLARVYCFANRVSMPPGDSALEAKGGAVAFGWFVWCKDHKGPP